MRSHFDANPCTLVRMAGRKAFSPEQRRRALREFMQANSLKAYPWAKAAGVSEASIRNFLAGDSDSLSERTYSLLAKAAQSSVAALRGEEMVPATIELPVSSYVGAGDEIIPIAEDGPIDYAPAPPGMIGGEVTEVRGRSMLPLYHDGDRLFHHRIDTDLAKWRGEVVVVQVKNGKRLVKLLQPGARRGRYTLVSINPVFAPLEDQQVDWVGPIEWVNKRRR